MDGSTTSEVQTRELVEPAIGIPCPAGNWAVHDRCPEEPKNQGWEDTTSLEGTSDDNHDSTRTEKHLVEAKHDTRNVRRPNRRISHNVDHSKIRKVSDERASRARIRQRKSPKHPLEGRHSCNKQRLEEHGQRRLSASEAAIEKTDARDNEPNDEAAEDEVGVVKFVADILRIYVDFLRVAAIGNGGVEGGLEVGWWLDLRVGPKRLMKIAYRIHDERVPSLSTRRSEVTKVGSYRRVLQTQRRTEHSANDRREIKGGEGKSTEILGLLPQAETLVQQGAMLYDLTHLSDAKGRNPRAC
jgi:hypothetical protein